MAYGIAQFCRYLLLLCVSCDWVAPASGFLCLLLAHVSVIFTTMFYWKLLSGWDICSSKVSSGGRCSLIVEYCLYFFEILRVPWEALEAHISTSKETVSNNETCAINIVIWAACVSLFCDFMISDT